MDNTKQLNQKEVYDRQVALIENFDLSTKSEMNEMEFVDLKQLDLEECDEEIQDFVTSNLEHGGRYALWVSQEGVMDDESDHLYPLASDDISTLTDSTLSDNDKETVEKAKELCQELDSIGLTNLGEGTEMVSFGLSNTPVSLEDATPVELKDPKKVVRGLDKSYVEKMDDGSWQVHPVTDTDVSFRENYHFKWDVDTTKQIYAVNEDLLPTIKDKDTPVIMKWDGEDLEEQKYTLSQLEEVGKQQIDKINHEVKSYQITPTEKNIQFNASLVLNSLTRNQENDGKSAEEVGEEITGDSLKTPANIDNIKKWYQIKDQEGKIIEAKETQFVLDTYEDPQSRQEYVDWANGIEKTKSLNQFKDNATKDKQKEQYQQYLSQQGLQR